MKQCRKCKKWKALDAFYERKEGKLLAQCKACMNETKRIWKTNNTGKVREMDRRWRLANPEKERRKSRKWYAAHPEAGRESSRKWRLANPEKSLQQDRRRRARKFKAEGEFTLTQWCALKERYGFTCLACGGKEPEIKLTPDHVKPLVKGGSNSIENIQPLCYSCNRSKNVKHVDYRR